MEKHQKPKKIAQHWVKYTAGVVGLSLCSMWLINHSRLVGSPDIDNWIREAKETTIGFWNDHVEQPVTLPFILTGAMIIYLFGQIFSG